ncbi:MAG: cyclic nucleotide-binding domain-containing protein, partial [Candidatus Limnocylindria bacterium]|nr:cyclic nucleotide-binding domain-containing protein [Candidatus Limnocylindria bacterium]
MSTPLDFGPFLLLGVAARERLVAASARVRLDASAEILREGDAPDDAYAIVRGRVRVTAGTPERALAVLAAPALVGEMAVVTGEPRSASVHAAAAVEALRIPATALAEAIREEPAFADELRAFAALRLSTNFLRRSSPFADLPSAAIDELAATLRSVRYAPGDRLVRQGERGDDAFLIRSGEVEVLREDAAGRRVANTLGPGALLGELSALTGAPRQATV